MALIDMDDRWLHVNNALCRITGYPERELTEKTPKSLTHPDDIDLDVSLSRQLLDGKVPSYQIEKRCIHAWGHFVWVTMTVSLVRDGEGRPLYRIAQLQDISERKGWAKRPSLSLLPTQLRSACFGTAASSTRRDTISVCHGPSRRFCLPWKMPGKSAPLP
jgi:PAS domain S-box-containing protein